METDAEILIVGGGLAGLRCACLLEAAGAAYRLFEAGDGWGGRVRTDQHPEGFLLDRGFQVFLTAYPESLPLFDYEALDLGPFLPGALVRVGDRFHRVSDPWRDPRGLGPTLRAPVGSLADKLRIGLFRFDACRGATDALWTRPDRSALEELRRRGFSERIIQRFFRPFFGGIFLDPELETSARMMTFVFRMFSGGNAALPAAGIGSVADQLARRLAPERLHLNQPVAAVRADGITLADGRNLPAAAVVLATDPVAAARLRGRPEPPMRSTAVVYFSAPESPHREPLLVLDGDGDGLSDAQPGYSPDDRALVAVSVVRDPEQACRPPGIEAIRDQLGSWYGRAAVRSWELLGTHRVPAALPLQRPGELRPGTRPVREPDGLYACGDYCETGSVNGALASGRRAAEAVLARLGGEGRL
jgi:phytoene dehydrogenase-like protein